MADSDEIARFIRERGVTKCEPAAARGSEDPRRDAKPAGFRLPSGRRTRRFSDEPVRTNADVLREVRNRWETNS